MRKKMSQNNTSGYIGCGIISLLGIIFLPWVTIPVLILVAIGTYLKKKEKKQDQEDLEDIKNLLKKDGHL